MLVGILIHSAVLCALNMFLPPDKLTYATADSAAIVDIRLSLRQFAETAVGICATVFFVGNIVILYSFIKNSCAVAYYKLFLLFGGIVVAMFVCAGPFAIADSKFAGDYFFPILYISAIMVVFFLAFFIANLIKHIHLKKSQ